MPFDSDLFRRAMGRFATGITVVTGRSPHGEKQGMTVNAFSSVSLDPPLVLVCLGNHTRHLETFTAGDGFNINLLAADQEDLSNRFASRGDDKFAGIDLQPSENGLPALKDALAVIECAPETTHQAGDHIILIGHVTHITLGGNTEPLLYYRSRYAGIKPD